MDNPTDDDTTLVKADDGQTQIVLKKIPIDERNLKRMLDLQAFSERIEENRGAMLAAKEEYSAAKKAYESELDSLRAYLRRLNDPVKQEELKFGDDGTDAWRDEPLAQIAGFGLADSVIHSLEEEGLLTMGGLADWTAGGTKRPEDIPGIGPAKAEDLANALEKFWEGWAEKQKAELDSTVAEIVEELEQPPASEPAAEPAVEAPKPKRTRKAG